MPVLYEFGFGLSYTSFAYSPLTVQPPNPMEAAAAGGAGGRPTSRHAPLLHVSVQVANSGGMAADEVVLLFLHFPRDQQHEQRRLQPAWQRWRWWQRGADPPALTLSLPCVHNSPSSSNATGSSADSLDVPRQTLVGFERLHSLAPGQTTTASFTLTVASFQPFSPLANGSRSAGGGQLGVRPSCGCYVLRAGSQEVAVWVQDGGPAAAS